MNYVDVSKIGENNYQIASSGQYVFFLFNYSGDFVVDIQCSSTEVFIYGLYIGKNDSDFKLNTVQHHAVGKSVSDLLIKGVFFDDSQFVYEGLIKIDKNAQSSNAYQKNQNILMSEDVYVDSRPYLEIEANEVRCTHGSTTGKLPDDQIHFLNMRGLSTFSAEKLLLEGFVNDVFDHISDLGCEKEAASSKIECLQQLESIFDDKNNRSVLSA